MSANQSVDICIVAGELVLPLRELAALPANESPDLADREAFATKLGYKVALIARKADFLENTAKKIRSAGGEVKAFPIPEYNHEQLSKAFEDIMANWPNGRLKCAVWNAAQWSRIPFMDITEADLKRSANMNMISAFAFSQNAIKYMLLPSSDPANPPGGSLLITGATSAIRGSANFAAFAAGKHALRAMSQSIAREYGKEDIHCCFFIIDGMIVTDRTRAVFGKERGEDFMKDERRTLSPEQVADAYIFIHNQRKSAWTLELDLRPSAEHF
ncbi:NAD(P)-binding protein [Atractiella rhizophila]|nr:NAD(P)-binding protein [Atractiella rhizophila]